jgi:hypothetical protein
MIFISYYTKNTPYEEVMNTHLLPSLEKFQLTYHIEAVEDMGGWQANTGYKCRFIKKMLEKYQQPVIFLDCDAVIEQPPNLFEELPKDVDIAVHFLSWFRFWRGQDNDSKKELLSGTMFINYTPNALVLLNDWIESVKNNPTKWEQRVLEEIVNNYSKPLKVYGLPIEYCTIIKQNGTIPAYIEHPVIIHHQASRKYKNKK